MPQISIPCTIMRGGTSKALFFLESDLPSRPKLRKQLLLAAFGSPDPRQVDGLGGADPLTSKVAIISPSERPDIDVLYTFGQVSIAEPEIDFSANCGNISSAVGPYAIEKGLVPLREPVTRIRILNTNTDKVIVAEVPTTRGEVQTAGEFQIDGVPGTGAEIRLHFLQPAGSVSGRLLPTGGACDEITLEDGRRLKMTLVDAGNPTAFVKAEQLGLLGDELPARLEARREILDTMEEIRARCAELLGLASSWKEAYHRYSSIPKIACVAEPGEFETVQGKRVTAESVDLQARVLSMGRAHKAYAVTAAVPTAIAARIPGSVVFQVSRHSEGPVRIGHPSGILPIGVTVDSRNGDIHVEEVVLGRTARKLMEGRVFLPDSLEP